MIYYLNNIAVKLEKYYKFGYEVSHVTLNFYLLDNSITYKLPTI